MALTQLNMQFSAKEVAKAFKELSRVGTEAGKAGMVMKNLFDDIPQWPPKWLVTSLEVLCDDEAHIKRCLESRGWSIDPSDLGSIIDHVKRNKYEPRRTWKEHCAWLDKDDIA
jgi:hypothetical protein